MAQLTFTQQAQIAAVLGTRPDTEKLSGMHYAYCNTGILTDMLTDDDIAWFDEQNIDIHADDFDINAHGELCCTEYLEAFKAISDDMEAVVAYAWQLTLAIKANNPTEHPNTRKWAADKLEQLHAVM
jgi:hypothetical protein